MGKHIHWLLLKKHGIPTGNKWYSHVSNTVTETDDGKATIYWDKPIKTDRKVSYNRLDVIVIDREENTWYIVDFAIPTDHHVNEKELEKIDKYMYLAAEVRRQFRVKTVIVPIVLGALGTVPARQSKSLEKLEIDDVTGSYILYIAIYIYDFYIFICLFLVLQDTDQKSAFTYFL